jgi:glyoxylase-like metal-dependent hydrolase (beta-lactamase superfamily II)
MHRWTIGTTEIVRIEDTNFSLPSDEPVPDWCVPDLAPSTSEVGIAFSVLAITSDEQRIVVDPWMANDFPRDEPDAPAHATRLLDELGAAGFPADEVDIVVNTHLDGIGWNTVPGDDGWAPAFPNARYLYPADELASIDAGEEVYGHEALRELRAIRQVEGVHPPLTLTSTVSLQDAPGHNAGHLAVRIEDAGDLAIYPGHLVLNPFEIVDPTRETEANPRRLTAIASRRAVLDELASSDGLLLTTLLGGSGAGRVERQGAGYRLRAAT